MLTPLFPKFTPQFRCKMFFPPQIQCRPTPTFFEKRAGQREYFGNARCGYGLQSVVVISPFHPFLPNEESAAGFGLRSLDVTTDFPFPRAVPDESANCGFALSSLHTVSTIIRAPADEAASAGFGLRGMTVIGPQTYSFAESGNSSFSLQSLIV